MVLGLSRSIYPRSDLIIVVTISLLCVVVKNLWSFDSNVTLTQTSCEQKTIEENDFCLNNFLNSVLYSEITCLTQFYWIILIWTGSKGLLTRCK